MTELSFLGDPSPLKNTHCETINKLNFKPLLRAHAREEETWQLCLKPNEFDYVESSCILHISAKGLRGVAGSAFRNERS